MDLIIIRHGRPQRVEDLTNSADPPLTELGHRQAQAVAKFLLAERIDHIVASPMVRARQTAQPLADALGMDPEIIDGLIEIDAKSNAYIPAEELKAEGGDAWQAVIDNPSLLHGGADIEAFADTVTAAFENIIKANAGRTVAVFCHGMVTMQFLRRLLGYDDMHALRVDYCGISRVQASTSGGHRSIRSVNETAHLGETRVVSP
jgi:probable phosphoglycerate mutase